MSPPLRKTGIHRRHVVQTLVEVRYGFRVGAKSVYGDWHGHTSYLRSGKKDFIVQAVELISLQAGEATAQPCPSQRMSFWSTKIPGRGLRFRFPKPMFTTRSDAS
ncbi:hypothetical protein MRX96_027888 [Rhipicephalus microplus]